MASKIHLVSLALFAMSVLSSAYRSLEPNHDCRVEPDPDVAGNTRTNGRVIGEDVGCRGHPGFNPNGKFSVRKDDKHGGVIIPNFDLGIGFGDPISGGVGDGGFNFGLGPIQGGVDWGYGSRPGYRGPFYWTYDPPYNTPYGAPYYLKYPVPYSSGPCGWLGCSGWGFTPGYNGGQPYKFAVASESTQNVKKKVDSKPN